MSIIITLTPTNGCRIIVPPPAKRNTLVELGTHAEEAAQLVRKLKLRCANVTCVCVCTPHVSHYASSFRKIDTIANKNKSVHLIFSLSFFIPSRSLTISRALSTLHFKLIIHIKLIIHVKLILSQIISNLNYFYHLYRSPLLPLNMSLI